MRRVALLSILTVAALAAATAPAAQTGSEGLVGTFTAKIAPSALPRRNLAPVQIRVEGEIRPSAEHLLAQLVSLEIALNRHGQMVTDGLPTCSYDELAATSSEDALAACGDALVGHGIFIATTALAEESRGHPRAEILAFNGRGPGGGTVIFLHVHGEDPAPFTVVIPVEVRRGSGTFGITLFARMPGYARRWAHVSKFRFVIGRRYEVDGRSRSLIEASCPAPGGLDKAIFPFARSTYRFLATKTMRVTLLGGCQVRRSAES
jgi:hypothetical protein